MQTWGNEAHVDAQFEKMKTQFIDKGVPVILGEYCASRRAEYKGVGRLRRRLGPVRHPLGAPARPGPGLLGQRLHRQPRHSGLFDRATGAQAFPDIISAIVKAGE